MTIATLPDTAPFVLQGVIPRDRMLSIVRALHTLNAEPFAGFPAGFLFFDSVVVQPGDEEGVVKILAGVCEPIFNLKAEYKLTVFASKTIEIWDRSDFGRVFEGFTVLDGFPADPGFLSSG